MGIRRRVSLVAATALIAGCREPTAGSFKPSFVLETAACPIPASVVVHDEAGLQAALSSATPGEVIALDTLIVVFAEVHVAVPDVVLTCAKPFAGLVAASADIVEMVRAEADGVAIDRLILEASAASPDGDPYLAIDVSGVRFTHNTVTCAPSSCAFFVGTKGAVVADNRFQSGGSFTGLQLQLSDINGIDGSRVERNIVVATAPSLAPGLGGIRVRDGRDVVVADNIVLGPWANSIAATDLTGSDFARNRLAGASIYGLRMASGPSFVPISMTNNVFRDNLITGAGAAGVFAHLACSNKLTGNDLRGNAGNLGAILDETTGANVLILRSDNSGVVVIDNGAFDCNGDGRPDPNFIGGPGAARRGVPFAAPASAPPVVKRGIEIR